MKRCEAGWKRVVVRTGGIGPMKYLWRYLYYDREVGRGWSRGQNQAQADASRWFRKHTYDSKSGVLK